MTTTITPGPVLWFSSSEMHEVERQSRRHFVSHLRDAVGYVDPRESVENQLWIALLYTCAVYRGVLDHPVRWPWSTRSFGYVVANDGRREPLISESRMGT